MWGNNWFALAVYLLPILMPQWHWAILASIIFAYFELLMHLVIFNIGLKVWYNPGLFTAICLSFISTWYLISSNGAIIFSLLNLLIALIWIVFNYWMAFLSPISLKFNNNKKYTFSKNDVMKSKPYMKKFPDAAKNFGNE